MTAEKMFSILGYTKDEGEDYILYKKIIDNNEDETLEVAFDKETGQVNTYYYRGGEYLSAWFTASEIKATYKQLEELGWM